MINVGWGESGEARVSSVTELDILLDRLSSEYRGEQAVLVELTLPSGDALSVGLGHERSVLSFVPGDGLPPYFVSRGGRPDGPGLVYSYYGRWTHFDETHLVTSDQARDAVRFFFAHGRLSRALEWVET